MLGSIEDRQPADRPLRWLLGAAGISSLGDGLAVVALPMLATRLTTDPRLIAGLLVAQRLPWLGLSLPAGALADRFSRLGLMRIADGLRAVVLLVAGISSLSGHLGLPRLYLLALSLGAAETVFSMASQATLADMVPLDRLDRANGHLFATQSGGEQLIGPALGGLVFAASASAPLLIDGFSFLASAALLAQVARTVPSRKASAAPGWSTRPIPSAAGAGEADPAAGIKAGLRAFAATPVLRVLLLLLAGLGLCQAMALALVVIYATRTLHLGSAEYGLFIAAGSIGNVAGGIAVARIRPRIGTATLITASAVAAASAYLILAATSNTLVAVAAFVVESFAVACGCVASLTVRQSAVAAELRGRIASIFRMAIYGAVPLGAMAGGVLAATGGVRLPLVVAGLVQLALAVATARPLHRRLPDPTRIAHPGLHVPRPRRPGNGFHTPPTEGHNMMKSRTKLSGMLLLIAGAALCFPQAASALTARAGPPAATTISPATTVPVVLIPPVVIHPATTVPVVLIPPLVIHPSAADPVTPRVAGPRLTATALPLTGSSHVLIMSVTGLCLIALGLLLRRGAIA